MGTKIKAKFVGSCKLCGENWAGGEDIYYQKIPKAICSDNNDVIITKIPEVNVSDSVKQIADMWMEFFVTAHHMTKAIYPEQDVNTHVFGQIRSRILDQLCNITALQKQ